jgi:hypothetical protein
MFEKEKKMEAWLGIFFKKNLAKEKGKDNIPSQGGSAFQICLLRKLEKAPLVSLTPPSPLQIPFRFPANPNLLMPSPPPSKEMDSNSKLTKKKAKHQLHL